MLNSLFPRHRAWLIVMLLFVAGAAGLYRSAGLSGSMPPALVAKPATPLPWIAAVFM